MLVCDNHRCPLFRTPQGTSINVKEILAEVNDGRKTKKLRGAKVESARRKSKAKRRLAKARKDGSQHPKVGRGNGKMAPGKRKIIRFV